MTSHEPNRAWLLTPPGAGAIGVIRVSGPKTLSIVDQIFRSPRGISLSNFQLDRLYYGDLIIDDEIIDDVVINRNGFDSVISVDICSHGGVRIIERILQALSNRGVLIESAAENNVPVWPASNLIEREADVALMQTKTIRAVRFLALQRNILSQTLIQIAERFEAQTDEAIEQLKTLSSGFTMANKLITGVKIALIGPPNSGKSTLFNQFIGRSAVVVSPIAGTTRDWVEESIEINGLAVTLVDTAGRHDEAKNLEQQSIEWGMKKSKDADLQLLVLDSSETATTDIQSTIASKLNSDRTIVVFNKQDLMTPADLSQIQKNYTKMTTLSISSRDGVGLEGLYDAIENALGFADWNENQPCIFSDRQKNITDRLIHDQATHPAEKSAIMTHQLIG